MKARKATLQQACSNETSVPEVFKIRLLIKSDARCSGDLSSESLDERKEGSIFVYFFNQQEIDVRFS